MAESEHTRRRVKPVHVYEGTTVQRARGALWQLREAGHVPPEVGGDDRARVPIEWRDAQGRRRRLRPYGTHLWEAFLYRLPEEAAAARQAEKEAQARWNERHLRAQRKARLEPMVATLPTTAAELRERVLGRARTFAAKVPDLLFGPGAERVGYVDAETSAAIAEALGDLVNALERARYRLDGAAIARLRTELNALEAREDGPLQRFLAAQVEAVSAP
jgi:hypothetical protein